MKIGLLMSTAYTLSVITSGVAVAQSSTSAPLSSQDAAFVRQAAAGGEAEIMMGQLAEKRGMNGATKSFAQMMIADHSKANDQLMQVTAPMGVQPDNTPSMSQSLIYQKLEAAPASKFDSMYARANVRGHKVMKALFKLEAASGQNVALKNYATQTLPVVEEHLVMAEKLVPMGTGHMSMMEMKASRADRSADELNAKELQSTSR
jgi:putative membrane protein